MSGRGVRPEIKLEAVDQEGVGASRGTRVRIRDSQTSKKTTNKAKPHKKLANTWLLIKYITQYTFAIKW